MPTFYNPQNQNMISAKKKKTTSLILEIEMIMLRQSTIDTETLEKNKIYDFIPATPAEKAGLVTIINKRIIPLARKNTDEESQSNYSHSRKNKYKNEPTL